MKWRLLKLDWKYGLSELGIVTVGVLVALYIEQWNSERLDRVEEIEVIERLIEDINVDLGIIELGEDQISLKLPALQRLIDYGKNPSSIVGNETEFLEDLTSGSRWGWEQGVAGATTYNELISAGRIGIIRSSAVRNQLITYYRRYDTTIRRTDERETGYPALSYELSTLSINPRELTTAELERTISTFVSDESQRLILAEENFAYFASERLIERRDVNEELRVTLQNYLVQLE